VAALRRKRHPPHENHERWLVSYADFITLLFAFFVVMFATTHNDKNKPQQFSASVREALEHGQVGTALAAILGKPGPGPAGKGSPAAPQPSHEPPRPDLVQSLSTLNQKLEPELATGKMQVRLEPRGLVISLRESAFFASGDDAVAPASYEILEKVAAVIQTLPNQVRFEGHTDARPIHTPRFRSNWELSTARSIAMLELFEKRFAVPRHRMAVAGYAENAPTDTNETDEGRARNRRVDVVLLAKEGESREPHPAASQVPHGK
jgi:chemotaxis protein MotB